MVLVLPVILLTLLIAVQASLYFHTSNVAGAAASQGASAASAGDQPFDTAVGRGRSAAEDLLAETGTRHSGSVEVVVSPDSVTVSVEAVIPRIVPFFPASVRRSATEPRERYLIESMR